MKRLGFWGIWSRNEHKVWDRVSSMRDRETKMGFSVRSVTAIRPSCVHRRRASVLVLVVTLLAVLFVTGITLLATLNFEADIIAADRQRDRASAAVEAVVDDFASMLRDSMMGGPSVPFGGKVIGESRGGFAELPGVHNLFGPVEPHETSDRRVVFGGLTDLVSLKNGPHDGSQFRVLSDYEYDHEGSLVPFLGIDTSWTSGESVALLNPELVPQKIPIVPVDADGDGITDTLQVDVERLGFSRTQIETLARQLNDPANPTGRVFLGLRVVAHGGLANLNASHPTVIANVLNLWRKDSSGEDKLWVEALTSVDGRHPELGFFRHRPALQGRAYSVPVEEGILRRRMLLPPRIIAPSLLHGNSFLDPADSPYGEADLATRLFPPILGDQSGVGFDTVYENSHRYLPFMLTDKDRYDPRDKDSPYLWVMRMEPFTSFDFDLTGNAYDRRHLVTTVSYDDLLSRGARWQDSTGRDWDLMEKMRQANRAADLPGQRPPLPFEYPNYPHNIPDQTRPSPDPDPVVCDWPTRGSDVCRFDPRKGRLLLSLPWLDNAFSDDDNDGNDLITKQQRQRLIHDVFMMLVHNARGPYWDEIDCTVTTCPAGEFCYSDDNRCYDEITGQSHRLSLLSRTAASLTANMLDYLDADDIPTRIGLRSFDFSDPTLPGRLIGWVCVGGEKDRQPCDVDDHCPRGVCAVTPQAQYVFGLERQPYITEVATVTGDNATGILSRAVELFNPYGEHIDRDADYWLIELDPNAGPFSANPIPLDRQLRAGEFTVFKTDAGNKFTLGGQTPAGRAYEATRPLTFQKGWVIYLVRRVTYPGDGQYTEVVVDQFKVDGQSIDMQAPPGEELTHSMERMVTYSSLWTAPIPDTDKGHDGFHTLGNWNNHNNPDLRPVEVNFAGTGRFAFDPKRPDDPERVGAFPTTGSLLLLMRHANRSFDEYAEGSNEDLAFTTWLDDVTTWTEATGLVTVHEYTQIDNGRMPVFDVGNAHHVDPLSTNVNTPGDLQNLSWGQLVFDYFTTLPLSNAGPYFIEDPDLVAHPASLPRVDLDGLRVHGRININAAPWTVLAGLPLVPMQRIPEVFRDKIRFGAGLDGKPDSEAAQIEEPLAQSIVAYREAREVTDHPDTSYQTFTTGDYGNGWRGWNDPAPVSRRGTGFMTVGELANVRHVGATDGRFRVEFGEVDLDDSDFVTAVARMVALGDWVTVRSHVFTIYGVLRGEGDESVADPLARASDVDRRAVRFQETIDRLPTFLGEPTPVPIGQRTMGKYIDVRND